MKILVVQTGFIGDVVLSLPVFRNLHLIFPEAEITALVGPVTADLIAVQPEVSQTIVYDKRHKDKGIAGLLSVANRLQANRYDIVFSLHKSWRTAVLLWLAKIPRRYGFSEASGRFLYTKTVSRFGPRHEVERNLTILKHLASESDLDFAARPIELELSLSLTDESKEKANQILSSVKTVGQTIGLAPGSVWKTKRWRIEGFVELARSLVESGHVVVLVGGKEDAGLGEEIEKALFGRVKNLIGKTTLIEAAAVISKLSVLVTNDSAPLHLASAVKTPTVAIFCATVPDFGYGPWQTKSKVLGVFGLFCRPCGRHGPKSCPLNTYACQTGLSAKEVFDATCALLPETARQAA